MRNASSFSSCYKWQEELTKSQNDLSLSESVALKEHLSLCPACSVTYGDFQTIANILCSPSQFELSCSLPTRLIHFWEKNISNTLYVSPYDQNVDDRSSLPEEDLPDEMQLGASDDGVRQYLREIGSYPLLTAEQELALATRVAQGNNRARQKLIDTNLRLVVYIAKQYVNQGLPLLDMIQEGNIGLMRATQTFDHASGLRFSKYAAWWIHQTIRQAIADHSRTIHIPVHVVELIYKIKRVARRLYQEQGIEASPEELAAELGLKKERLIELLSVSEQPLPLNVPMADNGLHHLANMLKDTSIMAPADQASQQILRDNLESAMASLNPREQTIIKMRYGLQDGHCHTLDEMSIVFHLTRERIRQIELDALHKLRYPKCYYDQQKLAIRQRVRFLVLRWLLCVPFHALCRIAQKFSLPEPLSTPKERETNKPNPSNSKETDPAGSAMEDLTAQVKWVRFAAERSTC